MRKYFDTITDHRGNGIVGASVTVRNYPANDLAPIYSDNGVTLIADSRVETDDDGLFQFYIANGRYTLEISGEGISNKTLQDLTITDSSVASLTGTGIIVALGDGTYTARSLTSTSTGLTINNENGVAGNPQFVLHPNLVELAEFPGGISAALGEQIAVFCLEDSGSQNVAITSGTEKGVWEGFPPGTLLRLWVGLKETSSSGPVIVDFNINGVSVMAAQKLRIEQGHTKTLQSTLQPILTTTAVPPFSRVSIDYDSAGTGAKGVCVWGAMVIDNVALLAAVYAPLTLEWMPSGSAQRRRALPYRTLISVAAPPLT